MNISLIPSVEHIKEEELKDKVVIVIDVLRATSVIVTALANGAKEVIPVLEIEDALELKSDMELLGGERKGLKIDGFDLSNSPLEYTREMVEGRSIIMTTTNGTRALHKAKEGDKIYIGAVINGVSAAKKASDEKKDMAIICAGTYGKFSLDDFLCAGKIIYEVLKRGEYELDDFAAAAYMAYRDNKHDLISYVKMAKHCKYLISIGLEEDIKYCFTEDIADVVPEYRDGVIKL
ncbi:2-phosphosulfolactate phosphatase [Fonticella tunisiensis]|uniref:Probable 2-phosphosulfolactate phosphatase n=1 Tax=Fonticella tunisiensis TaxID=1096341 RepID=A0A4R7KV63_9CLOT|nr:2-phosphosulfolactate phosphatase [Fonticella tunisiensis]TDT63381.1 2-phosphosulfolactate phosphatase [Fonticella tunisiensis]